MSREIFYFINRRQVGGVEGVHIVETRMSCTVCSKSSCLLICFHSWSLDLSQTLIQTIQILKEKFLATTMEKQKKNRTMAMSWPVSSQTGSWVDFLILWPKSAKTHGKTWKKNKTNNYAPCPVSQTLLLSPLLSKLSYWFWLLGHQRKRTGKHLYHPPLQALHWTDVFWYAEVLVPHL